MKNYFISFLFITILSGIFATANAQSSLYIPRNVLTAYEKGTRSFDGKPGQKYWVNRSEYKIDAEIFPETRTLDGHETITYHNYSPDTLKSLVFHLYHDNMKKGSARNFQVNLNDLTDGIKIDTMIIGNVGVDFKSKEYRVRRTSTNLFVYNFPVKIAPNDSVKIEVRWKQPPLPKETRLRMGAYSDSTFFFAYWYPQISVYDDIDGWDEIEYGGDVEFYNDIGSYDVSLTAPGDYLIWATGVIQNLKELVQPEIFEKYQKAQTSEDIVKIITEDDYKNKKVKNGKDKNTWHFIAENVPDFTFAVCNNYLWDGTSAGVDVAADKRVFLDAISPMDGEGKFEKEVAYFTKLAAIYFSTEWPGIVFPYPKMTIFNGDRKWGGGMESPMMCNDGTYQSRGGQLGVTVHEMAHTYFPFYMGINEKKYAWMDEGWACFFTFDLVKRLEPESDELPMFVASLNNSLGNSYMLPLITPSTSATEKGGGLMFYHQPAIAYLILRDFLGEEIFGKCLRGYMNAWHGKHPIPYDFFFTFNNISDEDLDWFWKPWFFEQGFPDLAVKELKSSNEIVIEKIGSYPVPVDLKVIYDDNSNETIHKTATVWKHGEKEISIKLNNSKKVKSAEILTLLGPDINLKNNSYNAKQ
jgi:hypothetical protein